MRCTPALHAYLQSIHSSAHMLANVPTHTHACTPGYLLRKLQEQKHLNVEVRVHSDWARLACRPHFERSLTLRGACWSLAAHRGPCVCVHGEEVKQVLSFKEPKLPKSTNIWIPMSPLQGRSENEKDIVKYIFPSCLTLEHALIEKALCHTTSDWLMYHVDALLKTLKHPDQYFCYLVCSTV